MSASDPCFWSATRMAEAVRRREISAVELTTAVLERIQHINSTIKAVSAISGQATAEAQIVDEKLRRGEQIGALGGVPVSIKDVIFTKGLPTTAGSKLYADHVPGEDAIVVSRLKRAGAVIVGKTNTPEFAHLPITSNDLFGETRNPYDTSRTAGGSSGGSAAAVAADLGPISIGNDGGGSIRIPAALCGVVGFKATAGRVPQFPNFPGWGLLGHTGPFARTVRDIRLVMDVIAGPDIRDPDSITTGSRLPGRGAGLTGLRVGWTTSLNDIVPEQDISDSTKRSARLAQSLGCQIEEVALDWGDPDQHFRVLVASEMAAALEEAARSRAEDLTPSLLNFIRFGESLSARDYSHALTWRTDLKRRIFEWFQRFDILLLPVTPVPAFAVGEIGPKTISGRRVSPYAWISWTYPFNLTGQPAISIPCGLTSSGLPIGLQIVGGYGCDEAVLEIAEALECQLGFDLRRMPTPGQQVS
jgi:amidase